MDLQKNYWYDVNNQRLKCLSYSNDNIIFQNNKNVIFTFNINEIKYIKKIVYDFEFYNDNPNFRY